MSAATEHHEALIEASRVELAERTAEWLRRIVTERAQERIAVDTETPCERCAEEGEEHGPHCPNHPDYDPTPWCSYCGSRTQADCHCGPIAENE